MIKITCLLSDIYSLCLVGNDSDIDVVSEKTMTTIKKNFKEKFEQHSFK